MENKEQENVFTIVDDNGEEIKCEILIKWGNIWKNFWKLSLYYFL